MDKQTLKTNNYDESYYINYFGAEDYFHNEQIILHYANVAKLLKERFDPRTVLDVGCACGHLVKALHSIGIEAYGVDSSTCAIENAAPGIKSYCAVMALPDTSLPAEFPKKFDLVTNIEVLEHLDKSQAASAVKALTTLSDTILFSSAPDEYDEETHLNIQPISYWCKLFAKESFYPDITVNPDFLSRQAVFFRKKPHLSVEDIYTFLDLQYARRKKADTDFSDILAVANERLELIQQLQLSNQLLQDTQIMLNQQLKELKEDSDKKLKEIQEDSDKKLRYHHENSDTKLKEIINSLQSIFERDRNILAEKSKIFADEIDLYQKQLALYLQKLEEQRFDFEKQSELHRQQLVSSQQHYDELRKEMDDLVNSKCWKLANFMRKLSHPFK